MTCPYRKITLDNGYNEIIEEFAECYIGIINDYENTTMVTLEELKSHIRDELELKHIYENDEMWKGYNHGIKGWTLADYCDKRKSTDLTRFNYCPMCGKEIDWKTMRDAMNKCVLNVCLARTYNKKVGAPNNGDDIEYIVGNFVVLTEYDGYFVPSDKSYLRERTTVLLPLKMDKRIILLGGKDVKRNFVQG